LRAAGKSVPAILAARSFSLGIIFRHSAAIAGRGGKRFHFSQNARGRKALNCWKNPYHRETAHGEDFLGSCIPPQLVPVRHTTSAYEKRPDFTADKKRGDAKHRPFSDS
jgi:hypothetical protein